MTNNHKFRLLTLVAEAFNIFNCNLNYTVFAYVIIIVVGVLRFALLPSQALISFFQLNKLQLLQFVVIASLMICFYHEQIL